MSTSLSTGRKFALLVATAALLLAMLPAASADAGPGAIALEGEVTFDQGFGVHLGTAKFEGTMTGVHGTSALAAVPAEAHLVYDEPLVITGTAQGSITIGGDTCGFGWVRTGTALVFLFYDGCSGHGVGSFVATSAPGSAPVTVRLAGTGYWRH